MYTVEIGIKGPITTLTFRRFDGRKVIVDATGRISGDPIPSSLAERVRKQPLEAYDLLAVAAGIRPTYNVRAVWHQAVQSAWLLLE